jgi:hypothetical protein
MGNPLDELSQQRVFAVFGNGGGTPQRACGPYRVVRCTPEGIWASESLSSPSQVAARVDGCWVLSGGLDGGATFSEVLFLCQAGQVTAREIEQRLGPPEAGEAVEGTTSPSRVQLVHSKKLPPHTRAVTGSRYWGNFVCRPAKKDDPEAHRVAIEAFRRWAFAPEQEGFRAEVRQRLRGFNLACWCKPHLACHADVLLEIANGEERGAVLRPAL